MQIFLMHFAEWQCNHHLLHFQLFITKNMRGGGNAKPLGCEKGPSSMLGSTSWQVFDQFSIFPDFHIPPREVKIFHFSLNLKQTNLNTEVLKQYLMFFIMTFWATISQSCIMWQLLQLLTVFLHHRRQEYVIEFFLWICDLNINRRDQKKHPLKSCSFSFILQRSIIYYFLTKGGTLTCRELSDQRT